MGMNWNQGQPQEDIVAEINITPLTDIFLVLLIIFMISSSAIFEGGLNVKLPQSKSQTVAPETKDSPLFINVSKEGVISLNNTQFETAEALGKALKKELGTHPDKTVVIRGDEELSLGITVQVMDEAKEAGAKKIAIATRK